MSEIFPPVANSFYLKENFRPNKAALWHQYFTGAGQDDNSPQWIKIASWTHTNQYNTFGAQFNIVSRNANLALQVQVELGGNPLNELDTTMSFTGTASSDFKAKLVKVSDHSIGGLPAIDVELWVRHGADSGEGFVSVDRIGGHKVDFTQAINLSYKDIRTLSTLGNEIEPTGDVIRSTGYASGVNYALETDWIDLNLKNGWVNLSGDRSRIRRLANGGIVIHISVNGSAKSANLVCNLPTGFYETTKQLKFLDGSISVDGRVTGNTVNNLFFDSTFYPSV